MPQAGFEPSTPASDRPQTLALDRSATVIGGFDPLTVQSVASCYIQWVPDLFPHGQRAEV